MRSPRTASACTQGWEGLEVKILPLTRTMSADMPVHAQFISAHTHIAAALATGHVPSDLMN